MGKLTITGGIIIPAGSGSTTVKPTPPPPPTLVSNPSSWDPLDKHADITLSGSNLIATNSQSFNWRSFQALGGQSTGKYYFEISVGTAANGDHIIGVAQDGMNLATLIGFGGADDSGFLSSGNKIRVTVGQSAYGTAWGTPANNDVASAAVDLDNGAIWFAHNGTWQAGATKEEIAAGTTTNAAFTGLSGTYKPTGSLFLVDGFCVVNFGNTDFTHGDAIPSGFTAGWPAS